MSVNLPSPGQMAVFIACVEFFGGIFFALGAFSRITSLVLTVNLTMAYVIADREALYSIFSDPDKFAAAALRMRKQMKRFRKQSVTKPTCANFWGKGLQTRRLKVF